MSQFSRFFSGLMLFVLFLLLPLTQPEAQAADVLLVLGSDTGIWDGMGITRLNDNYTPACFIDPSFNTNKVMQRAYRESLLDSYGTPVKLTWWMLAGNIFHYAVNTNVPLANTMTLDLMKKYYGTQVKQFGDELSLHYHTFVYTDYDKDGIFYWNQAHGCEECREDFDVTMAQLLLEENTYPVSFLAGWHYMDNPWQNYLNTPLPYSLHNDYPHVRLDTTEPTDNLCFNGLCKDYFKRHQSRMDYISTKQLVTAAGGNYVEMNAGGSGEEGKNLYADTGMISPLIKKKALYIRNYIDLGAVSTKNTLRTELEIFNKGYMELTNTGITNRKFVSINQTFPLTIPPMGSVTVPLNCYFENKGSVLDTLFIGSNDNLSKAGSYASFSTKTREAG